MLVFAVGILEFTIGLNADTPLVLVRLAVRPSAKRGRTVVEPVLLGWRWIGARRRIFVQTDPTPGFSTHTHIHLSSQ